MLLALKMEKGGCEPRCVCGTLEGGKSKDMDSFPHPPETP